MAATTTESGIKLVKKVKDDKFSIEKIEQYCLILQFGLRDFQLCIVDTNANRVLILEDYILPAVQSADEKHECLKSIFDNHHLLLVGFWKEVVINFKSDKFCLAPLALFSKDNARAILNMNCEITKDDSVGYYKVNSNNSVNIFTYDKPILKWLRAIYKNSKIKVTHQSGMLVNSILNDADAPGKQKYLAVFFDRFYFHVGVVQSNQLLFFNSYKINKFEEYSRYINLVLHEFNLSKSGVKIRVFGFMKKASNHLVALQKSYPKIELGTRSKSLKFGFKFDEVPEQQYADLFGSYFNL